MFKLLSTVCACAAVIDATPRLLRRNDAATRWRPRVYHGQDNKDGENPFVVKLFIAPTVKSEKTVLSFCTGSLITPIWVLSAAHCFGSLLYTDDLMKDVYVWYKNFTESPFKTNLFSKALKRIEHPGYKASPIDYANDIGLVLVTKINVASYGRVLPVDYATMMGLPVTYVGGGITHDPKGDKFRPLQVGEGAIVPCHEDLVKTAKLCVTAKCSQRTQMVWAGDSGGPLLYDGKIVAVTSISYMTGDMQTGSFDEVNVPMAFAAYTAISPYMDWITEVMHSQ